MNITRPTIMEVDINALKYNIEQIKKYIGTDITIMPIIKANAYGTYINNRLDILNNFHIVGVATIDEAINLRKAGYNKEIFVLNQPYQEETDKIIDYDITIGLSEESFLKVLATKNKLVKVHLEIETGMNRTGIDYSYLASFIEELKKYPNIIVEGIYTHLSSADYDKDYTNNQLAIFKESLAIVKKYFPNLKYVHTQASNGIINFPNNYCNLVRPGLILYGYDSFNNIKEKITLKPICKLKSKVTFIKTVPENSAISYSQKFVTTKPTKIATIPIGYADGLKRQLSNLGEVVINNQKAKIIGNICMDSIMVDITHIDNVTIGTDVYIWDNNLITVEDIANKLNTINYEILCTISERVPRIFIDK